MKRNVLISLTALAVTGVFSLAWIIPNHAPLEAHSEERISLFCPEGTWVLKQPDGRFVHETINVGRGGKTLNFTTTTVTDGDPTLGGLFPNARISSPSRGSGVRIAKGAYEFRGIIYARNIVDGVAESIAYIVLFEGTGVLTDCNTQENVLTLSYFLPESDSDGDGIPDEGAEPFLVVPDIFISGKKLAP